MNEVFVIIMPLGATLFMALFFLALMRNQLEKIIMYVVGNKEYKREKKSHQFRKRITLENYKIILPKWTMILYYIQIISSLLLVFVYTFRDFFNKFVFTAAYIVLISVNVTIPLIVYFRGFNLLTGNKYDYSKFVDKYAIRRKLYPELYQDEDE